ncbi:MAG: SDR family NAD(P)-dependent oxidoreductase [Bacteroidales bacterium]|nr:SDR family NAD(P)-dependent oxidoreductase [Bacteroidales bacterium]
MNKAILVTGADGNLGKAVTRKFLDEGYKVIGFIHPTSSPDFMESPNLEIHQLDLMDEEKTFSGIEHIDTIEGAVLTVGGFGMGSLEKTSLSDVNKMYKLNFATAYNSARAVYEKLKSKGLSGQIVLIGTKPAFTPEAAKGLVAYSLSKSLVHRLAEIINADGQDKGITSSVIVPSIIDTPENREAMPNADFDKWVKPEVLADNIHHLFTDSGKALRETVLKVYHKS